MVEYLNFMLDWSYFGWVLDGLWMALRSVLPTFPVPQLLYMVFPIYGFLHGVLDRRSVCNCIYLMYEKRYEKSSSSVSFFILVDFFYISMNFLFQLANTFRNYLTIV